MTHFHSCSEDILKLFMEIWNDDLIGPNNDIEYFHIATQQQLF